MRAARLLVFSVLMVLTSGLLFCASRAPLFEFTPFGSDLVPFTEEAIFRLPYVTMGANDTASRTYGLLMGSLVFGIFHYWGIAPNGVAGALMSAFLGFFLAKSIQETKGFFWAFTIHFGLNVAGMSLILNSTP